MKSKIKAHHVAIVAVCTIAVFILSFELGKFVHRPASAAPTPYHGVIYRHIGSRFCRGDRSLSSLTIDGSRGGTFDV
jgi:hypothetical protein